jgi:replicative DNA helicase
MVKDYGKIPPQATEVEEAVLGSLMLEQDAFLKVSNILGIESFYKEESKKIFSVIKSLYEQNKPVDLITVTSKLRECNSLEEVGGALFITQLTNRVSSVGHIEHHARIIQQKYIQRELIKIGSETTTEAFDDLSDIEDLINNLKHKISVIEDFSISSNAGQSQSTVIDEAITELEKDCIESAKGKQPGITTGLFDLNNATGGWRNTNFIIIASRPGIGKTSLALHFAKVAAKSGKWVNFYGLEMKSSDLMRIILSGQSGVNRTSLRDGKLISKDWDDLNASIPLLEKLPIIWNDYAGTTVNHIKTNTAKNVKNKKCDLVIVDYLQLITPTDKKQNREQQISDISRNLKRLALSENIPVIALAQLNREAESVKPQLNHLRESGSMEQDADIVIFPWVEDGKFQLTIAKNRRGRKGTFEIHANEEMTGFYDISKPGYENYHNRTDKF